MGKKGGKQSNAASQQGNGPVIGVVAIVVLVSLAYNFSGESAPETPASPASDASPTAKGVFAYTVKNANSKKIPMSSYKDKKALLIVNTASQCGFTGQYKGLQDLYTKYASEGLEIIGFPSNQFQQEPGTNPEIQRFVKDEYQVTFPVMQKIVVNGAPVPERSAAAMAAAAQAPPPHPLFKYLTSVDLGKVSSPGWAQGLGANDVQWNFSELASRGAYMCLCLISCCYFVQISSWWWMVCPSSATAMTLSPVQSTPTSPRCYNQAISESPGRRQTAALT
jgi:glutathione peroxidase